MVTICNMKIQGYVHNRATCAITETTLETLTALISAHVLAKVTESNCNDVLGRCSCCLLIQSQKLPETIMSTLLVVLKPPYERC